MWEESGRTAVLGLMPSSTGRRDFGEGEHICAEERSLLARGNDSPEGKVENEERRQSSRNNANRLLSGGDDEPTVDTQFSEGRKGFNILRNSESFSPPPSMIDNTELVYIPMLLQCGVMAHCRPDVLVRCPLVLRDLNCDIFGALEVLPPSVHALVKRTNIWINTTYYYGTRESPRNVNHSTTHHHEGWLIWVRDKREKTLGIEIYNCFEYQKMRLHWNGCGLVLHELCHLIHQVALHEGLDNSTVQEAHARAKASGRYNEVLRRDWAGMPCETDMAYGMVNHKEFFAEMSVTFLCDSYHELDGGDGQSMDACSPPFLAHAVRERLKSKSNDIGVNDHMCAAYSSNHHASLQNTTNKKVLPEARRPCQFLSRLLLRQNSSVEPRWEYPHCNKFFPFTRGQLKLHDQEMFQYLAALWSEIESWEDSKKPTECRRVTCCAWR